MGTIFTYTAIYFTMASWGLAFYPTPKHEKPILGIFGFFFVPLVMALVVVVGVCAGVVESKTRTKVFACLSIALALLMLWMDAPEWATVPASLNFFLVLAVLGKISDMGPHE